MNDYNKCLKEAKARKSLNLCPRGYCTAKHQFEVYPSAYANGYATQVCKGEKPDYLGKTKYDGFRKSNSKSKSKSRRRSRRSAKSKRKPRSSSLSRWYREKWVNVCKKGNGPGGFAECGSGDGVDRPESYPYCRAYYKLPGTKVVTVEELKKHYNKKEFNEIISKMCKKKRSLRQGVDGKPTRVNLPRKVSKTILDKRQSGGAKRHSKQVKIPNDVKRDARLGLKLLENGFAGGTQTGWDRAEQLANNETVDVHTLAIMRAWYARHGPDAKNGGTSYPGYRKWVEDGRPMNEGKHRYRGAVAWLIWGGDAAYKWLKTKQVRNILSHNFPNKKTASLRNNLE